MSWEQRNGRGRYYTRSRRIGGRVVREYIGSGPVAALVAQMDALDRREQAEVAEARRRRKAKADALDATVEAVCRSIESLTHAVLIVAGYRRHHRGEWRKRRAKPSEAE